MPRRWRRGRAAWLRPLGASPACASHHVRADELLELEHDAHPRRQRRGFPPARSARATFGAAVIERPGLVELRGVKRMLPWPCSGVHRALPGPGGTQQRCCVPACALGEGCLGRGHGRLELLAGGEGQARQHLLGGLHARTRTQAQPRRPGAGSIEQRSAARRFCAQRRGQRLTHGVDDVDRARAGGLDELPVDEQLDAGLRSTRAGAQRPACSEACQAARG